MTQPQPSGRVPSDFRDPFAGTSRARKERGQSTRFPGKIPGEVGIWVLIAGDMCVFGMFFFAFLITRRQQLAVFEKSRGELILAFGAINTLLLLTASLFVVQAMKALRAGDHQLGRRLLGCAWLGGFAFVVDKGIEWGHEFSTGHNPNTNDFYMFYFVLCAVHLLHLSVGLLGLFVMTRIARKPVLSTRDFRNLESGASFWHLVDLLWIVIFPLLYVIR